MGIMKIGEKYYVSFKWKGNRIRTVTPATNANDAKRIEKAVKTAFKIGSYGHLDPEAQEVVVRTFDINGWALPPELDHPAVEEDLTLIIAVLNILHGLDKCRFRGHHAEWCPRSEPTVPFRVLFQELL